MKFVRLGFNVSYDEKVNSQLHGFQAKEKASIEKRL